MKPGQFCSVALTQTLHTWLRAPLKTCGLLAEFAANIKIHLLFEKKISAWQEASAQVMPI